MLDLLIKPLPFDLTGIKEVEKYSEDGAIQFDPKSHTYYRVPENTKFSGCTSVIESYKPRGYFSTKKVERELFLTGKEVRQYWKNKNDVAKNRGHFIHSVIETCLLNMVLEINDIQITPEIKNYIEIVGNIPNIKKAFRKNSRYKLKPEMIVYSDFAKMAGQIDLLVENEFAGEAYMYDWKTNDKDNEELYKGYGYIVIGGMRYKNSSWTAYCIQLSLYAEMYENNKSLNPKGLKIKELNVVHLHDGKATIMEIPQEFRYVAKYILVHGKNVSGEKEK